MAMPLPVAAATPCATATATTRATRGGSGPRAFARDRSRRAIAPSSSLVLRVTRRSATAAAAAANGDAAPRRVDIYDTTLRDGSQQVGISLTCDDKLEVASHLVSLGVSHIEGGYPGSNPKDVEFFNRWDSSGLAKAAEARGTKLCAFGMTRRKGVEAKDDEGLNALVRCVAPCACIVAKAWDEQCERVLGVSGEENLAMITDSVSYLVERGKEVLVDCEHFYDGHAANGEFAMRCAVAAAEAGATHVVLCDTNGGTLPWVVEEKTRAVVDALKKSSNPSCRVGVHTHNDTALAVANSLAGVRGGASMVQGCVNGYGERTGNADVLVVAANLELKMGVTALPPGGVAKLTATAAAVAKACKQPLEARQPYVGSSAFAHKGGLHVAALAKMPSSYNHVVPGTVGNAARSVVSELSGRGNVLSAAVAAGREVSKDTAGIVLAQIKELESKGFVLEDAGASVDILFQRAAAGYRAPFNVLEFNVSASNNAFGGVVTAEGMEDAKDLDFVDDDFAPDDEDEDAAWRATSLRRESGYKRGTVSVNQVVVKVELLEYDDDDDATADSKPSAAKAIRSSRRRTKLCVAEGNGPVNALANALQLALNERFPQLKRIHLVDYQVDLLSSEGTSAAVTRVTMDFVDRGGGGTWRTVGAHASIIEASFRALVDGMEYGIAQCGADGCVVGEVGVEAREGAPETTAR